MWPSHLSTHMHLEYLVSFKLAPEARSKIIIWLLRHLLCHTEIGGVNFLSGFTYFQITCLAWKAYGFAHHQRKLQWIFLLFNLWGHLNLVNLLFIIDMLVFLLDACLVIGEQKLWLPIDSLPILCFQCQIVLDLVYSIPFIQLSELTGLYTGNVWSKWRTKYPMDIIQSPVQINSR